MKSNRESKRVSIELRGNYRVYESDFPYAVMTVVNISHTGICFTTDEKVDAGNSIELKVMLDGKEVQMLARVVWSNQLYGSDMYSTGVQIMDVNAEGAKQFKEFYQAKLLYPPAA